MWLTDLEVWEEFLLQPEWASDTREVIVMGAYMQIFCAFLSLCVSLVVLAEIRKGPWFVTRVVVAIILVAISILVVQTGIIFNWFDTNLTNAIGTFVFCLYVFLDIEVYWSFSIRYWETSFHITSYFKRQSA